MSEESLQFVGSAARLFFCILIVHSLWMTARKIPAARNVRPNGVKGGLLLTVIFCFAMVVIAAASAANILIFVNGQRRHSPLCHGAHQARGLVRGDSHVVRRPFKRVARGIFAEGNGAHER